MGDQRDKGLQRVGDILPKLIDKRDIKPFTPMHARLLAPMAEPEDVKNILYQHSVLCQTCNAVPRPRCHPVMDSA